MNKHIQNSGFDLEEIKQGSATPVVVDPDEIREQDDEGGLDALYFVTNQLLHDRVSDILECGAQDGKFDLVTLNEVATRRTTRIGEFDDDEYAHEVMVQNIDRLTGELRELEKTEVRDITSNYPIAKPNDVLYLRLRPYRRKVTVVPNETEVGSQKLDLNQQTLACSGEICVLKPPVQSNLASTDYNWHPEYLQMILQSDIVLFQLLPATKGGTRPRVPFKEIMQVQIPWPKKELRDELVEEMTRFQNDLKELKQNYNNLMGSTILDGMGISPYENQDLEFIFEGIDERLASLLMEADLLPESFSSDPFDQMS